MVELSSSDSDGGEEEDEEEEEHDSEATTEETGETSPDVGPASSAPCRTTTRPTPCERKRTRP